MDAFKGLQNLIKEGNEFDLVIIDPPSFAKSQTQIEGALHSYRRLVRLGIQLVNTSGILVMASCSSRIASTEFYRVVEEEMQVRGIRFQILDKTEHDIDHPITFPEGAYLKCGYYRIQ